MGSVVSKWVKDMCVVKDVCVLELSEKEEIGWQKVFASYALVDHVTDMVWCLWDLQIKNDFTYDVIVQKVIGFWLLPCNKSCIKPDLQRTSLLANIFTWQISIPYTANTPDRSPKLMSFLTPPPLSPPPPPLNSNWGLEIKVVSQLLSLPLPPKFQTPSLA